VSWRLAALYVALTLLLSYPLSVRPAHTVASAAPDTDLFMWTLAWDAHAFVSDPVHIFDANIYHPQRLTLAYSENLIGSAILAAPLLWTTGNPVLAMNVVALLACVLCAFGTFLLGRRVGLSANAAAIAGLVFAFSPPRFLRLDQLHLITMQWMPFALASFHAYLDAGRRRDLWLTIGLFTLQALSSGHGAVFTLLALAGLFSLRLACGLPLAPARRLREFGWQGALLLAPVLASIASYRIVQREMGLRRTLENWSVPASSFLASPSHVQVALLSLVPDLRINETAGAYLFPGVLPIVLAALAYLLPRPPRTSAAAGGAAPGGGRCADPRLFYGLLTLVALWLAAGPPISLWPLVYWLPGLNFIRAPSRFVLLAILGLAVLAGVGVERLIARVGHGRMLAIVIGALLVLEFAAFPLGVQEYRVEVPAIDRWLASQPKPFVVAEVPLPDSRDVNRRERRQTLFMLHSTAHWQKTVHGYSGLRPPLHDELYRTMLRFPDEESIASLERLGVTYVVVHTELYEPGEWPTIEARLAPFEGRLRLLHEEQGGRVYELVGRT
jgi:hypothetical protein